MNTSIENNGSIALFDNEFNADSMEQSGTKLKKKLWIQEKIMDTKSLNVPNVLDPDDSLMKRFQNALREHLIRVDNKLSSEILDLVRIFYSLSHI